MHESMSKSELIEQQVRQSFLVQADLCEEFGSVFTANLIRAFEAELGHDTETGTRVLTWPGPPEARGDALALRLAGAFHSLVLSGKCDRLAAVYPPHAETNDALLRKVVRESLQTHDKHLLGWLDFAPQTNEVGRSAVLYLGLMDIAQRTALPIDLLEIGSSAGLNLTLDQYLYHYGDTTAGRPGSRLVITPEWKGRTPAPHEVTIETRRGCDLAPLDIRDADDRLRLSSYIWPDQRERQARFEAATDIAKGCDFVIEKCDAATWVEKHILALRPTGRATVLMHSLVFCYLPADDQKRITDYMESIGREATEQNPLAWLSFELNEANETELTLQYWPTGEKHLVAQAHPHGRHIRLADS